MRGCVPHPTHLKGNPFFEYGDRRDAGPTLIATRMAAVWPHFWMGDFQPWPPWNRHSHGEIQGKPAYSALYNSLFSAEMTA
jgi:hypothetical protein